MRFHKFTDEQKQRALELSKTMPIKEAAKQAGCSLASLSNWKREQKNTPVKIVKSPDIKTNLLVMKVLIDQISTTCNILIDAIKREG